MGRDQRWYTNLVTDEPKAIGIAELEGFLFDVSSGTNAFGPLCDWMHWYRFLLPSLVERSHEAYAFHTLGEITTTAFFHFFPTELDAYPGLRDDVLVTLGRCLMKPEAWTADGRYARPVRVNRAGIVLDGAVSAQFAFGLHYLRAEEIPTWIASATAIADITWQAQVLGWLAGALEMLRSPTAKPSMLAAAYPCIEWNESFLLESLSAANAEAGRSYDLFPETNRRACLQAFAAHFDEAMLLDVLDALSRSAAPEVAAALGPEVERLFDTLDRERALTLSGVEQRGPQHS